MVWHCGCPLAEVNNDNGVYVFLFFVFTLVINNLLFVIGWTNVKIGVGATSLNVWEVIFEMLATMYYNVTLANKNLRNENLNSFEMSFLLHF